MILCPVNLAKKLSLLRELLGTVPCNARPSMYVLTWAIHPSPTCGLVAELLTGMLGAVCIQTRIGVTCSAGTVHFCVKGFRISVVGSCRLLSYLSQRHYFT